MEGCAILLNVVSLMGNGMRDALEETDLLLRLNLFFFFPFFPYITRLECCFFKSLPCSSFLDMLLSMVIKGVDYTPQVHLSVHGCFFFDH